MITFEMRFVCGFYVLFLLDLFDLAQNCINAVWRSTENIEWKERYGSRARSRLSQQSKRGLTGNFNASRVMYARVRSHLCDDHADTR